jgi:hypothetical protein
MKKLALGAGIAFALAAVVGAPPAFGATPTIDSITPDSGTVGTVVTIAGTDFTGTSDVSFHGTSATSFNVDSDLQITATVPVGATTGPVTVTNADGPTDSSSDFTVLPPAPTVTSFDPVMGRPGRMITILGTDLTGASDVVIAGEASPAFLVVSPTEIRAKVPFPGTVGPIEVTTDGGTGSSAGSFEVLYPPQLSGFSPRRGPMTSTVIISGVGTPTGSSFLHLKRVMLGHKRMHGHRLDANRLAVKVPLGAKDARIRVVTAGGSDRTTSKFLVRRYGHRSLVTLGLSGHLLAAGSVVSRDHAAMCQRARVIVIQRQVGGRWQTIRTFRSLRTGKFRASLPDNVGVYRAVVLRKGTLRDLCSAATSRTRKHHHQSTGGGGGENCTPGYTPCLIYHGGADYDCAGGSGDGPYYTQPGVVYHMSGPDIYNLDGNDNDGLGCERS